MVKLLSFRFQQSFSAFYHVTCRRVLLNRTCYTFISPRFSESVSSKIHQLWESSLFWKCSKLILNFKYEEKNSESVFCFRDNFIWRCYYKLSLLRREYLSSAVNVQTALQSIIIRLTFHISASNLACFSFISKSITYTLLARLYLKKKRRLYL